MSIAPAAAETRDPDAMTTQELLTAYKTTGNEAYKWPLVLRYEGLIKSVALQIRGVYSHFAQVDDIVDEGILTILGAIDKFDPDKGIKFETYISKRIRGMVIDLARKQDWIPRNVRKRARDIDEAIAELYSQLGRYPSDEEVAGRLGISTEKYQKSAASVSLGNMLSLNELMDMHEADGTRFELPDPEAQNQPEAALQDREAQQVFAEGIGLLRKNEQIVLSLYYERNLHMKEIAQVLEVSEPRVSQIHARAIQKLRDHMENYMTGPEARRELREKRG